MAGLEYLAKAMDIRGGNCVMLKVVDKASALAERGAIARYVETYYK